MDVALLQAGAIPSRHSSQRVQVGMVALLPLRAGLESNMSSETHNRSRLCFPYIQDPSNQLTSSVPITPLCRKVMSE